MANNIENSPKLQGPTVQTAVLPDPNLLNEISPWDIRFHQLEAGRMVSRVSLIKGENLGILDLKSNLGLHQAGAGPKGAITLGIPISGDLPKWRQDDVVPHTLLSFGAGAEFDGVSGGGFHGLTFSMPEDYHDTLCDRLGLPQLDTARQFGLLSDNASSKHRGRFASFVLGLMAPGGASMSPQTEDEICTELLLSMTENNTAFDDKSSPETRTRARRRAIGVMHQLAPTGAKVSEICAQSGVGWRTLDRAFLEFFGFGPKTYFKILRLSRVREDLVANGLDQPVFRAANRWGFWHLSQFAQDYRRFFHELPSETQKRGKWSLH